MATPKVVIRDLLARREVANALRLLAHFEDDLDYEDGAAGGTFSSNGTPTYVAGKSGFGQALDLDSGDNIYFNGSQFPMARMGTIFMWFNPDWAHTDGNDHAFADYTYDGNNRVLLWKDTDNSLYARVIGATQVATASSTQTLVSGTWYSITMTWLEGDKVRLYFNGSLVATSSGDAFQLAGPPGNVGIGAFYDNTAWFIGQIDEFMLFDRPLAAARIQALHNKTASLPRFTAENRIRYTIPLKVATGDDMALKVYPFVQGDRHPILTFAVKEADGQTALDLSGCEVLFFMRQTGAASPTIDGGTCTITSEAGGSCEYEWAAGDLGTAADYYGDLRVEFSDATHVTSERFRIQVRSKLGS